MEEKNKNIDNIEQIDEDFNISTKHYRKSKTGLVIFLTILITAVVLVGGYFAYQEFFAGKETKKVEKKKKVDIEEITASEEKEIMDKIDAYIFFGKYFPIHDISAIDKNDFLLFALQKLQDDSNDLTKKNVTTIINNYFGKGIEVNFADVNIITEDNKELLLYTYDSSTEKFTWEDKAQGVSYGGQYGQYVSENSFVFGTKQKDVYTIEVKAMYLPYCRGVCGYMKGIYLTPQDSVLGEGQVYELDEDYSFEHGISNDEKKEILGHIPITTYTFKKVGNNFVLVSIMEEDDEEHDHEH